MPMPVTEPPKTSRDLMPEQRRGQPGRQRDVLQVASITAVL